MKFPHYFKDKKVLITGNTGFKGSWLSIWMLKQGAEVYGISDKIPTQPSLFEELKLEEKTNHQFIDIRDREKIEKAILDIQPDFVFHMAAQPLVSVSYEDPLFTISTNVMGTANVLEALKNLQNNCTAIIITSDKCYENIEQVWGYKENDQIGGKDIYSGSKGAAEVIFHSYFYSFFRDKIDHVRLATVRAGNVIGGGDWAKDRIVPDCMKAWSRSEKVTIRSPYATRPWQHVLEPLSGYIWLACKLRDDESLNGESFNFGPKAEQNRTVLDLIDKLSKYWDFNKAEDAYEYVEMKKFKEAGLLKLNIDKALFHLDWEPNLNYEQTIRFVSEWYFRYYRENPGDMYDFTMEQLEEYEHVAIENDLIWTGE